MVSTQVGRRPKGRPLPPRRFPDSPGPAAIPRQRPELSERQRDVLEGLAQGQRQKQIAYNLQISENTVAYHVAQLRRRLECSHSNEIVAAAYLAGLLTPR